MSELIVLNCTGDERHVWAADDAPATDRAREVFEQMRHAGYLAYRTDGDKHEQINTFEPDAKRITMAPAPVGG